MARTRSKVSADQAVGFLNNINSFKRNAAKTRDSKRRRTTNADIYDIPSSPSPTPSVQIPRTEPRKTTRRALRNRRISNSASADSSHNVPDDEDGQQPSKSASPDSSHNVPDDEEGHQLSKSASPNPSHNAPDDEEDQQPRNDQSGPEESESELDDSEYDSEDEEMEGKLKKMESDDEQDLFSIPSDMAPDDEEAQVAKQLRATFANGLRDEYRERPEDQAGRHAEEQAGDTPRNTFDGDDDPEAESRNNPTPTQQTAKSSAIEVQIIQRRHGKQKDPSHESRASPDAEASQGTSSMYPRLLKGLRIPSLTPSTRASSQIQEVPESVGSQPLSRALSDAQASPSASWQIQEGPDSPGIQPWSRASSYAQASQRASSQIEEVPESTTIQSPHEIQAHRKKRSDLFSWLTDATKESVFKDDWEEIRTARKIMKNHADSSMKERFRDITKLIARLRLVIETITLDPDSAFTLRAQCSLIANSVFKEAQWIIYSEATEDEQGGGYLVNQLEAHVVPRLIDLLILGFKGYKTINNKAAQHFSIILDLLWGCSEKITALADLNFEISMEVSAHSRKIMSHARVLKAALRDGRLREKSNHVRRQAPVQYRYVLEGVDSQISCGPWTQGEKDALCVGLEFHEGDDRYIDLKCDEQFGPRLSARILKDIRAKAIHLGFDD
ncbi:hypothetical protein N7535_001522 [Penicillium sp. DV-2018c]|nr:hypothetical protein N7461_005233 [Penicillium sp. DV-2018c]KAJ5582902.1 hypothetical protein N7535_001522 [Penicillium sp. DV-2018c]